MPRGQQSETGVECPRNAADWRRSLRLCSLGNACLQASSLHRTRLSNSTRTRPFARPQPNEVNEPNEVQHPAQAHAHGVAVEKSLAWIAEPAHYHCVIFAHKSRIVLPIGALVLFVSGLVVGWQWPTRNLEKSTPEGGHEQRPPLRFTGNPPQGRIDTGDKSLIQARLALGVIAGRLFEFVNGLGMNFQGHPATACLTRFSASSAENVFTCPLRTSSRRRNASAAHRRRTTLSSAGSRLSTRRSARSARASLGNARASSAICSTVMLMP